jgi:ATP-dependent Clp protease ATP-binding subunit ClpA
MLLEVNDSAREKNINLIVTDAAKEYIIDKDYDKKYGARPLRRAIQREIADPLSIEILSEKFKEGDTIIVDCNGDQIIFSSENIQKEEHKVRKKDKIAAE